MNHLNENYSDILKSLNKPNVQIKEFLHDVGDFYFSIRNSEDESITLRMKNTLVDIIELHEKPNQLLIIHFVRSVYDIVGDGSNTLDAFYYVKYEEIIDKQDVEQPNNSLNQKMNETVKTVQYKGHHDIKFVTISNPDNVGLVEIPYLHEFQSFEQKRWFPWNVIEVIVERHDHSTINPGTILEVDILKTEIINNPNGDIHTLMVHYSFRYVKHFPSKLKTEDIIKSSTTSFSLPMSSDDYVKIYGPNMCKEELNFKGHVYWTDPIINCPYVPKHLITPTKLVYKDYPTVNFYQIETLCPIDELDYWKAIGEEILSMDDVDEAVKFHKQFYHSKQKFRLVKIQKQLLGDI